VAVLEVMDGSPSTYLASNAFIIHHPVLRCTKCGTLLRRMESHIVLRGVSVFVGVVPKARCGANACDEWTAAS
jgi:hypothetical protein